MNDIDKKLLDDHKTFISPELVAKYSHKQTNPKEWVRFYYYKNKKRIVVEPKHIEYDYEVSSTLNYNKQTFYKMTTMSSNDGYFDYYFKLKDHLPSCILKKSNRNNKTERTKCVNNVFPKKQYEMSDDGKFIVRFE